MRLMRFMVPLVLIASASLAVAADAPKKATTIDELAKMFDSTSCKECHETHYAQWEKSHHARPFMGVAGGMMLTPVVKSSAFKIAKPEDATIKTFPCFKCHLPQALRWAEDSVAQELAAALMADPQDKAKVAKLQITCKVCHWEKAIAHKLVEGQPKEGVIYGSTGEIATGVERSPELVRRNQAQWFMEEFVLLAKHGCQPWYRLDLDVCENGTRAALTTPFSCDDVS